MNNFTIPHIETQGLDVQEKFQLEKLAQLIDKLTKQSPFYRKHLAATAHHLRLSSLKDLAHLPTTTKQHLQQNTDDFLCVPKEEIAEYMATSGTLGKPVYIAMTQADLERLAYNEWLSFNTVGLNKADTVQLMLTLDRQFMAGTAYYTGLQKLGATTIRTGPGLPAMQWETMNNLNTTALVAVPSFLHKMILFAQQNGLSPLPSSVKKVLCIGEALRDEHLAPNTLAKQITEKWPVQLFGTYAATEMQTAFTECAEGAGGHHHPELVITELLDEHGNQVAPGSEGEVTFTTLGVEAMPLLRYRTGDICKAYYEPCACGRKTMRLGPVLGRKQQMIKLKGTSLYPPAIFEVLHAETYIDEYVVELKKDALHQDELTIFIHTKLSAEACSERLKPIFRHKWRVMPTLIFLGSEEINKMLFPAQSRKPVRFRDVR
ncbi:MAG: AMP-binding protein [Edaphocola sp.]